MKKTNCCVHALDVGSNKLVLFSGYKNGSNGLIVNGKADIEYAGFLENEFLEPEEIKEKIGKIIETIELSTKETVKELNVGVPAEFCYSLVKKVTATFSYRKKLSFDLLNEIYSQSIEELDEHTLISVSPLYNILDNGKKVINAVNLKTSKFSSLVNTIYVKTEFIRFFNQILSELGIIKVNYLCSALCEVNSLLGDLPSEACIIDIGFLTSSVAIGKGQGLSNLFSFSQGGGHIISDLMNSFSLTYDEATELKRKIVLTIESDSGIIYDISSPQKTKKILVEQANSVVKNRLDIFASVIKKCLQKSQQQEFLPIYVTGGGISSISGAKEYLSSQIGKSIGIIYPNIEEFSKPYYSSGISLLQEVIKKKEKPAFLVAKWFYILYN